MLTEGITRRRSSFQVTREHGKQVWAGGQSYIEGTAAKARNLRHQELRGEEGENSKMLKFGMQL